jgi:uncharacterized protein YuzE
MAIADIREWLRLVPALRGAPGGEIHSSYDAEADVLYITFGQDREATDSELTEDDLIVRYGGDAVIGVTVLHASQR